MIDNLTEAISHAKEEREKIDKTLKYWESINAPLSEQVKYEIGQCKDKLTQCNQKIAWLTELAERREADRWISVSERLPDDLEPVNITWINHDPEPYYADIKDKPFTATGVYFNGQWYWWSTLCADMLAEYSHNFDDVIDTAIEVIAWRPLPEAYKESEDK